MFCKSLRACSRGVMMNITHCFASSIVLNDANHHAMTIILYTVDLTHIVFARHERDDDDEHVDERRMPHRS